MLKAKLENNPAQAEATAVGLSTANSKLGTSFVQPAHYCCKKCVTRRLVVVIISFKTRAHKVGRFLTAAEETKTSGAWLDKS
jgi:hypothetical protein